MAAATINLPITSGYTQVSDPATARPESEVPFRELIPSPDHPRIAGISKHDALSWCNSRREVAAPAWLINRLEARNLEKPYKGFTTDGHIQSDAYSYQVDEGFAIEEAVAVAEDLLRSLSPTQRELATFKSVEDDEFRLWSNPELYVNPGGLRLDQCSETVQSAVHNLLKASFSPEGYSKVLACCLTNGFLGKLVNGQAVLNMHSYNFRLFGEPHQKMPWGYTFFGHHLCLAVVFQGRRVVIGPTFMGAEPDTIDEGIHKGLRLFKQEEMVSLKLMQSLPHELQELATLSKGMTGEFLPPDRYNPFDERHLGGARQDNRIVPFEGCPVSKFNDDQLASILTLFRVFNEYYPSQVLEHRLNNFKKHLNQTYFAWIGGFGDHDPYYFRIHSPVAFMEFDFHCGIFLTNTSPAKCHIHTVNRLPNAGDYGKALLASSNIQGQV